MQSKVLVFLVVLTVIAFLSGCTHFDPVTDSEVARAVVNNFLTAMENEDAVGMADLLDESFYTLNEINREGFIAMMNDTFSREQFYSLTPTYSVSRVSGGTGRFELFLNMNGTEQAEETEQDEPFNVQVYFIFDVIKTGGKWLVVNFVQSTPDEPIIRQVADDFVAALQQEDLGALENLLSEHYNDGSHTTRDEYLAYLAELFTQIQINSYTIESWTALWIVDLTQESEERVSTVQVFAVMTMDMIDSESAGPRMEVLGFGLEQVNGKWVILSAVMTI